MIKILIIDDDPSTLLVLKNQLMKVIDANVYMAESLEEAACKIGDLYSKPDLIFLDLFLPGVTEFDIKTARETLKIDDVPIIAISIRADINTIIRAIEQGAASYLIKPINIRLLVDAIAVTKIKVL